MQEYVRVLGDIVKQSRVDLKLTQSKLAEIIDSNERTIANIERYQGNPKMEVLWPLIRALDIDANTIFYPEQAKDTNEMARIHMLLSRCSAEEINLLLPICESILETFRSTQSKPAAADLE